MHVVKVLWENFGNVALKKLHWRALFACFVLNQSLLVEYAQDSQTVTLSYY